jgi:flagellar motor switch protein FliG
MRPATGTEKAALVLLALGGDFGGPIWKELDDHEIAALGAAIARIGTVEQVHAGAALSLFANELAAKAGFIGTSTAAEALITKVLPEERATLVLDQLRRPSGPDLWERLASLDDETILRYLSGEHPQTTATVLSQLPTARAASLLAQLPQDIAVSALKRFSRLGNIDRTALAALERTLSDTLVARQTPPEQSESAIRMAAMFDSIEQPKAEALLQLWSEDEAETAERVRSLMFTFDDFRQTSPAAMQVLMRNIDRDALSMALKGAPDDLKQLFFDQLSARAARMLEDQIASRGAVRRRDVLAAQTKIVQYARQLEASGELKLRAPSNAEDAEEMVE